MNGCQLAYSLDNDLLINVCGKKTEFEIVKQMYQLHESKIVKSGRNMYKHIFYVLDDPDKPFFSLEPPPTGVAISKIPAAEFQNMDSEEKWMEYGADKKVTIINARKLATILDRDLIKTNDIAIIILIDVKSALSENGEFEILRKSLKAAKDRFVVEQSPRLIGFSTPRESCSRQEKADIVALFGGQWIEDISIPLRMQCQNETFELTEKEKRVLDGFVKRCVLDGGWKERIRDSQIVIDISPNEFRAVKRLISYQTNFLPQSIREIENLLENTKFFGLEWSTKIVERHRKYYLEQCEKHHNDHIIQYEINGKMFYVLKDSVIQKPSLLGSTFFNPNTNIKPGPVYTIKKRIENFDAFLIYFEKNFFVEPKTIGQAKSYVKYAQVLGMPEYVKLCRDSFERFESARALVQEVSTPAVTPSVQATPSIPQAPLDEQMATFRGNNTPPPSNTSSSIQAVEDQRDMTSQGAVIPSAGQTTKAKDATSGSKEEIRGGKKNAAGVPGRAEFTRLMNRTIRSSSASSVFKTPTKNLPPVTNSMMHHPENMNAIHDQATPIRAKPGNLTSSTLHDSSSPPPTSYSTPSPLHNLRNSIRKLAQEKTFGSAYQEELIADVSREMMTTDKTCGTSKSGGPSTSCADNSSGTQNNDNLQSSGSESSSSSYERPRRRKRAQTKQVGDTENKKTRK